MFTVYTLCLLSPIKKVEGDLGIFCCICLAHLQSSTLEIKPLNRYLPNIQDMFIPMEAQPEKFWRTRGQNCSMVIVYQFLNIAFLWVSTDQTAQQICFKLSGYIYL